MTITLLHTAPTHPAKPSLESTVAGLINGGPDDPARIKRAEQLPNPTRLCCAIVSAAVESFQGVRPVHQLLQWVSPQVYEMLTARVQVHASRTVRASVPTGPPGPPVMTGTVRVLRSRAMRISPAVVEAAVVVHDGKRARAAAVRMEEHRGKWQVTALEIG